MKHYSLHYLKCPVMQKTTLRYMEACYFISLYINNTAVPQSSQYHVPIKASWAPFQRKYFWPSLFPKMINVAFRKSTVRKTQMCPELIDRVHQTNRLKSNWHLDGDSCSRQKLAFSLSVFLEFNLKEIWKQQTRITNKCTVCLFMRLE